MRKIIFNFLFILCIGFSLFGLVACDNEKYEIRVDGYTLQIEENGEYSIIGIPQEVLSQTTWRVPEKIGEYPISRLGSYLRVHGMWESDDTLYSLGDIRRIYLPECITLVRVRDLTKVVFWETEAPLSQIAFNGAFPYNPEVCFFSPIEENDRNVRYITQENIVNDNMVICANDEGTEATLVLAFGNGSLKIPDTFDGLPITTVGERALYGEEFDDITLGANIKIIGEQAFFGVPITQMELFEGITTLGTECFSKTSLTNIVLPSTITTLGDGVFDSTKLESFDLSKTQFIKIEQSMFGSCPLRGDLKFSEHIKEIGAYAFAGSGLTEIQLPETLTRLGRMSFANCRKLKSFRVPNEVSSFCVDVVSGCESLESLHLNMAHTFQSADDYLSERLLALKEFSVSNDNQYLLVENGILYNKEKTVLYWCPAQRQIERITIDSKRVMDYAFYGNVYLKEVIFTENNTTIGMSVFEKCTSLESVQLSFNLITIPFAAFRGCSALKRVNTEHVEYFNGSCFANCSSLQEVDFSSSRQIGEWAFRWCDLQEVRLGKCTVDKLAFADNTNLKIFELNGGTLKDTNALWNTPLYEGEGNERNWKDVIGDFLCKIFPFLYRVK